MTLDPRRAAVWRAMGLGPVWQLRSETAAGVGTVETAHDTDVAVASEAGSHESEALDWTALRERVAGCTDCGLCRTRTQTVFGVGHTEAHWMIVGEAPGAEEDARGEPFVGQAGKLLDNMLASVGMSRRAEAPEQAVFIANVLKCRPPNNRNPEPHEVAACEGFLQRQLELVNPRLVVVMGRFAAQSLLSTEASIASLRGKVHGIDIGGRRVPVVVTYHPAYLLRNLADKSKSWADLCLARSTYRKLAAVAAQ
jgi:uracil-DNA glycosylase family 4